MKDQYRETGTIFRRSALSFPGGGSFASRVRAVIADHARQLQGTLARVKREGGRFTQGIAGKKRTTLPGGVLVETWINPHGLIPTLAARVTYQGRKVAEIDLGPLWSGLAYPAWEDSVDPELRVPTIWVGKTTGSDWAFWSFSPDGVSIFRAPDSAKPRRIHEWSEVDNTDPRGAVPYHPGRSYGNTCLPGSYSGKMKAVVQRMLGAGQKCEWNSSFNDCVWVCTVADGEDWLIHFSQAYGLCTAKLEYMMRGEEKVAAGPRVSVDRYKWTTLLSTSELAAFFNTQWFSIDIGFSVDTTGHNAVNLTNVRYDLSPDGQSHVLEWELSIIEGLVSGVQRPTSATLTIVEDSIAWYNLRGLVRAPNGAGLSTTVSWGHPTNVNNPPMPAGQDEFRWPIHAYYDGDAIVRYYANFAYVETIETTPPDPVGATDADVWKANGYDTYPYVNSFPANGSSEHLSLGYSEYRRSIFWFEGPDGSAVVPDKEQAYSFTDIGEQWFEMQTEGSVGLVSMGVGVSNGGEYASANRYRKQSTNGGSYGVSVAAWLPNGDREAILFMKRVTSVTQSFMFTHSVRNIHLLGTTAFEITGCGPLDPRAPAGTPCNYIHMKKNGGLVVSYPKLPAPVDGRGVYADTWHSASELPDGACKTYGTDWVCSEKALFLPNSFFYNETLPETIAATTTVHTKIYVNVPGANAFHEITFDEDVDPPDAYPKMEYLWAATPENEYSDFPLYVNRTYKGNGIFWDGPATTNLKTLNACHPEYAALLTEKGIAIWVGEPET